MLFYLYESKPSGFDTDNTNAQVSQLNGNVNISTNKRVGPSIVLKVMAGDTVSISTYAWYTGAVQPPATGVTAIINDLLPLLTNGVIGDNGTKGGSISSTNINTWMNTALTSFLANNQPYNNTRPKAFLNWMVVDEEFIAVSSTNHLGAVQVPLITGTTQKQQLVGPTNMVIRRNGWLYVYVSNEANQNVYFDDLVINHKRGPLVEQKDYYAFGLEIPGLSTQAFKPKYDNNRYKYNGKEYDTAFALDENDYGARMYDPQIGRWGMVDPKSEKYLNLSLYNYAADNPILFTDPDGREIVINYEDDNKKRRQVSLKSASDIDKLKNSKNTFLKQMYTTLSYLKKEKTLMDAIKNRLKVEVDYTPNGKGGGFDKDKTSGRLSIGYDPKVGAALVNNNQVGKPIEEMEGNGKVQSPALGFLHELDHFLGYANDNGETQEVMKNIELPLYDNYEEYRVITGSESQAANHLGEASRTNHYGIPIITEGPASTKMIDYIPSVKLLKQIRQEIQNATKKDSSNSQ